MNSWSRNFTKCLCCGTTNKKHEAKGLCCYCYKKKYNSLPKYKEYKKIFMAGYNRTTKSKEYNKEYIRKKRIENPSFRLSQNISHLMYQSLKTIKNGRKWEELVGYKTDKLVNHLEKQFDDKMNWDNYGSYWWVDHIKPRSLFKYTTTEEPEFKECWALKNLQPLEKIANIKKGNSF